jgi:hypothetical protein
MVLSRLKPDSATQVGVLTAAGVYLIYNNALPNLADIRSAPAHDDTIEKARRAAAWKSAALVGLVFLVARDINSYIISAGALFGIDYMYKHGNAVNPATGKLDAGGGAESIAPAVSYPRPDYDSEAA